MKYLNDLKVKKFSENDVCISGGYKNQLEGAPND